MPIPARGNRGQFQRQDAERASRTPPPQEPMKTSADEEVAVELPQIQFDPVQDSIEARVVYLGGNPRKTVYYEGSVTLQEDDGGEKLWIPSNEGSQTYDFSRTDSHHRLIKERLTPDGKVWSLCRHIDHLARFMVEVDEDGAPQFRIMCKPADKARIERWARLKLERRLKSTESGPALLAQMGMA